MAVSCAWMFGETKPDGGELMRGVLIPKLSSSTIKQALGVVGCIIMPHNVFLHSALVQSREVDNRKIGRVREALTYYSIESGIAFTISFMINLFVTTVFAKVFYGTEQANTIGLVNAGQFIMGGFLNLRLKKWTRALITRSCAIIPTLIVALIFDTSDASLDILNEWLNALQSIQIPLVFFIQLHVF